MGIAERKSIRAEREGIDREKDGEKMKKSWRKELPYPVGQTEGRGGGGGRFMTEGIFGVFSPLS